MSKIDKLINGKIKNKLYIPDGNEDKILNDYSKLYSAELTK